MLDDLYSAHVEAAKQRRAGHSSLSAGTRSSFLRWSGRLWWAFYPWANAAYEGAVFSYHVAYLLDATPYFHPVLHLQRIAILRSNPDTGGAGGGGGGIGAVKAVLLAWYYAFRLLDWWYATQHQRASLNAAHLTTPPPPLPSQRWAGQVRLPRDPRFCALCRKPRTNAAAAPDGFVLCYPCLFAFIRDNRCCPVSGLPATTDDIRKLYEDTV